MWSKLPSNANNKFYYVSIKGVVNNRLNDYTIVFVANVGNSIMVAPSGSSFIGLHEYIEGTKRSMGGLELYFKPVETLNSTHHVTEDDALLFVIGE